MPWLWWERSTDASPPIAEQDSGHCRVPSSASTASVPKTPVPSKHKRTTSTNSTLSTLSTAFGKDVVALVDKFAFHIDLTFEAEGAVLKRFKNGAACLKWLSKRLNPERAAEGERVIVLVKSTEHEVIATFVEAHLSPRLVVVQYGDGQLVANMDDAVEEARRFFAFVTPAPETHPVHCPIARYMLEDVEGLMWIDEMAGSWRDGNSGLRGFVSAHKAIGWMERQMKMYHVACAACTTKRRCPACCKSYRSGQQKQAWVGDRFNALVVAHHAPVLKAYLTQFPENGGPVLDLAVYGGKGDTDSLTFEDAANALGAGGFQVCAPSSTTSTAPGLRSDSDNVDEPVYASSVIDLSDEENDCLNDSVAAEGGLTEEQLAGLRALTPVPEDSEFPWLFYDTIRAAQNETLRMAGNLQLDLSLDKFATKATLQHSASFTSQSAPSPKATAYQGTLQPSTSFVSSTQSFRYVHPQPQPVQLNSPTVTAVVYPVSLQPGWSGY